MHQSSRQIEYIWHLQPACHQLASRIKNLIKYNPVHQHGYYRLSHCPDNAKIRAGISFLEIVFGKLPDKLPALPQFHRNRHNSLIIDGKNNAGKANQYTAAYLLHLFCYLVCQGIVMPYQHIRQNQTKPPENKNRCGLWKMFVFLCRICRFHSVFTHWL